MIFLNNLFGGGGGSGEQGQPIDYVNGTLTVTLPKTEYIHGDTFNTSGAVVKYTSPAGEVTDVTSAASFDPSNGSSLTLDGENTVRVSYTPEGKDTVYATQIITVAATPQSLTVVLKDTGLRINEAISYKGAKVTALMSDRTEKDVSGATLVWSPLEGTVQDRAGSVNVKCSYTENGVTADGSAEMNVTDKTLTGLQLNLGTTQYYYNEQFDIATTEVTATYDDGSTASVKSKCEWLPEVRTKFTDHGDQTIYCSYTENSVTKKVTGKINVKPIPVELTVTLSDYGFQQGEVINYANKGIKVMATWSDNTTSDVTDKCSFDPPNGTTLTDTGRITIKARYRTDHWDITSSTNGSTPDQGGSGGSGSGGSASAHVTKAKVVGIGCDFPNKDYKAGDQLNLEGAHVTALYDDGTTADVTGGANWSPSDGSTLKVTDTKVTCSYSENGGRATQTVQINVSDVPTKLSAQMSVTDYEVGDKLDTSGSQVVLTYASGRERSLGVNEVTWKPANKTDLKREGTQFISVTYTEDGVEVVDRISVRVTSKREKTEDEKKQEKQINDRNAGRAVGKALAGDDTNLNNDLAEEIGNTISEASGDKPNITDADGNVWIPMEGVIAAGKKMAEKGAFQDKHLGLTDSDGTVYNIDGPVYVTDVILMATKSVDMDDESTVVVNAGGKKIESTPDGVFVYFTPDGNYASAILFSKESFDAYQNGINANGQSYAGSGLSSYSFSRKINNIDYAAYQSFYNGANAWGGNLTISLLESCGYQLYIDNDNRDPYKNILGYLYGPITENSAIDWNAPDEEIEQQIGKLHETWDVSEHEGATTANGTYVLAGPIEYNPGD